MKKRIPCDEWSCVQGKLEGGKEQAGCKNKYSINNTLNQPSNEFIVTTKKDKTDTKSYSHHNG